MRTVRWTDAVGRLAEYEISDKDAERLRRGETVASYASEGPRTSMSDLPSADANRQRIADLDRDIARLEHQQAEIRRELDEMGEPVAAAQSNLTNLRGVDDRWPAQHPERGRGSAGR